MKLLEIFANDNTNVVDIKPILSKKSQDKKEQELQKKLDKDAIIQQFVIDKISEIETTSATRKLNIQSPAFIQAYDKSIPPIELLHWSLPGKIHVREAIASGIRRPFLETDTKLENLGIDIVYRHLPELKKSVREDIRKANAIEYFIKDITNDVLENFIRRYYDILNTLDDMEKNKEIWLKYRNMPESI